MIPYTVCKGCVFAQGSPEQSSCQLDRPIKLGLQDDTEDGHFVLKRVCSTYRPDEWLSDLSLAESEDIVATVRKEVIPPVGFFIVLKTEEDHAIGKLEATLIDIKNQDLESSPSFVVVITDKVEYNEEAFALLDSMFEYDETKYHIVQLEMTPDTLHKRIDEAFRHAKNGWAYVTSSGESVASDLMTRIDKRVNEDMKKLVVIKPYDAINGLLFQTTLFKFVNGNKSKLYEDEVQDSRSFLEKIEEASQRSDDNETFITWEEFNAS